MSDPIVTGNAVRERRRLRAQVSIPTVVWPEPVSADAYRQVKVRLEEIIKSLADDGVLRLPSEDQLRDTLGVSRPTIRSALLSLQKEGKVRRVHGSGTFINLHSLRLDANLAEDRRFVDLLARLGYEASVRTLSLVRAELPGDVTASLGLAAGAAGCAVERLFEASGEPAVLSVDYVPLCLLKGEPEDLDPGSSTFELVARHTDHEIRYSVAELRPVLPDEVTARTLAVDERRPLLLLRHVHIDQHECPVAVTTAFVDDAYLRFSVVRTYVDL